MQHTLHMAIIPYSRKGSTTHYSSLQWDQAITTTISDHMGRLGTGALHSHRKTCAQWSHMYMGEAATATSIQATTHDPNLISLHAATCLQGQVLGNNVTTGLTTGMLIILCSHESHIIQNGRRKLTGRWLHYRGWQLKYLKIWFVLSGDREAGCFREVAGFIQLPL